MSPRDPICITVPGDKSISHRCLIFAALAEGESRLDGLLDAGDTRSTASALRALGVEIPGPLDRSVGGSVVVRGRGPGGLQDPAGRLDCGNSGTTARLLLGVLAGSGRKAVLTGDASLRRRPMRRVTQPLATAGARFTELGEEGRLPIRVEATGALNDIDHLNEQSSAQVKTAMLLAGVCADRGVRVEEPRRSRDHTERLLLAMGAPLKGRDEGDGAVVTLERGTRLDPLDVRVPGDISSAAFFLGLAALVGGVVNGRGRGVRVNGVGLNPTRTVFLDVLRRMGAEVMVEEMEERGGEPVGAVTAAATGRLTGTVVAPKEVPGLLDEVPILAAVAAMAEGETRFNGIGELRVKESDRIQALVDNLQAVGVETDAGPDHLAVNGTKRELAGAVESFGDHRIAMAFGVLGAVPGNHVRVRGQENAAISYPTFWEELERVRREVEGT